MKVVLFLSAFLFLNTGLFSQGSQLCFSSASLNPLFANTTTQLFTQDINADGFPDIIIDGPRVFLSNGTGGLSPMVNYYNGGSFPYTGSAADFNGDGQTDILMRSSLYDSLLIFNGNANGTFSVSTSFSVPAYPFSTTVTDINNDSHPDILVNSQSAIHILAGNGSGSFVLTQSLSCSGAFHVIAEDLDNDGLKDVGVGNGNSIVWYKQTNLNTFAQIAVIPVGNYFFNQFASYEYFKLHDVNNDGFKDILALGNGIVCAFGAGNFQFSAGMSIVPFNGIAFDLNDFNSDGKLDVAVIDMSSCLLYQNNNGTNFLSPITLSIPFGGLLASQMGQIRISDMNADGRSDLIFAGLGGFPVQIYENCLTTGTAENKMNSGISILQNPVIDNLEIVLNDNIHSGFFLEIYNTEGKSVKNKKKFNVSGKHIVDCSSLSPGTYNLIVRSEQKHFSSKVIVIR